MNRRTGAEPETRTTLPSHRSSILRTSFALVSCWLNGRGHDRLCGPFDVAGEDWLEVLHFDDAIP